MTQLFVNNFSTTVAATFGIADTSLTLTDVTGLPVIGAEDHIALTVYRQTGIEEREHEVIHVTSITGNVLTVLRAIEGAAASQFLAGDRVQARVTASSLTAKADAAALALKSDASALTAHTGDTVNPHAVTKAQLGLGSVDDTADVDKPVSTAQQAALDLKQETLVSGTNIKTVNSVPILGAGDINTLTGKTHTALSYTRDDDGTVSGGTWAIDYANGPVIKATAGAAIPTITMASWPATGTAGHLRLMLVNFGLYTITFPAAWTWVKSDLTTTTTFADLSLTLPSSGTAIVDLFSDDGGVTIYATVLRG